MNQKKIYIAGCGGMLGEAFYKVFSKDHLLKCTDIDVNAEWLSYLDFNDLEEYRKDVINFKPDYLFHLGAYTDLEYCEKNSDDTYLTNTISVENAVYISNELNIPLLFISTAGIYDGRKQQYDDWDMPNPLGVYARSKYMAENFVKENKEEHIICRAGWMMGAGPLKDKKFINKIMLQLKEGKETLHIVDDKLGTPTYTIDFARNVKLLFEKKYWGLYNMVCGGEASRLEVCRYLIETLGLENRITIEEVKSTFFSEEYFAPRPYSERLLNKRLDLKGVNIMRDWKTCLDEYLKDYYKDFLKL